MATKKGLLKKKRTGITPSRRARGRKLKASQLYLYPVVIMEKILIGSQFQLYEREKSDKGLEEYGFKSTNYTGAK